MRGLLILLCLLPLLLSAQKVVQLEKYGQAKTKKFYIGDELTYQLANDDYWRTSVISDINPEEGYLLMDGRLVYLNQIIALRSFKSRGWSRALGKQFLNFSGGWLVFGMADRFIFTGPQRASWELILIPSAVALALAWIVPKAFKHRNLKLGKRRRLRLLDLTPRPFGAP